MRELLPCPFCGSKVARVDRQTPAGVIGFVHCGALDDGSDGCGAVVSFRPSVSGKNTDLQWNQISAQRREVG